MNKPRLNPYTQAITNCLSQFKDQESEPELDENTSQFLANMIQGRFLQYLVSRICDYYKITDSELEKKLLLVMMNILRDKFFAVFREKIKEKPEIVYKIARTITNNEKPNKPLNNIRTDALYSNICKKYFEYQDFNIILRWINTNPEVEKIVFLSQVQKYIHDTSLIKALRSILQHDKDGIVPIVFNRYLRKNKIGRLHDIVKSGEWKLEAAFVEESTSRMIAWRNYMGKL